MKKQIIIASAVACALLIALAGCTSSSSSSASSASASASSASASASAASESASSASSESSASASADMVNPWHEAASAEEAAKGAGLDGFSIIEGLTISYGEMQPWTYKYMEGIAEARSGVGAVELVVRKGAPVEGGDISGDYTTYANSWTQVIKGLEVTCFGDTEGLATKTIWSLEDASYCIMAHGQGSEFAKVGLTADEINSFVNGMQ